MLPPCRHRQRGVCGHQLPELSGRGCTLALCGPCLQREAPEPGDAVAASASTTPTTDSPRCQHLGEQNGEVANEYFRNGCASCGPTAPLYPCLLHRTSVTERRAQRPRTDGTATRRNCLDCRIAGEDREEATL